ncbi:hypothetical protein [Clavibacter michiganensis]|uniref:hypothetical protein n=1 Tax=Clavibacter michiganensis TaxID=28447 RepID=UPI00292DCC5B|nr:hypothetical protein [Clavibacter michiganensis]
MTDVEQFRLAELSIRMFASPETIAALLDDVVGLLEKTYDPSAWEVASQADVTGDAEHREALIRLRQEVEVARRVR